MDKKKIIFLALITTVIGFSMTISVYSTLFSNLSQLIFLSVGQGLFIGPIIGMVLSVVLKEQNKK